MSDAANLPGPLGAYATAFKANDLQRMRQIVQEVISADEIILPHPETGVMCRCRSSTRWGLVENILFFSDDSGGNRWSLVQVMNFFQYAVTETSVVPISSSPDPRNERLISQLRSGAYDHYWDKRYSYGGLIVCNVRPYHFFYDQFLHLPDVINQLPEHKRVIHTDGTAYLAPSTSLGILTEAIQRNKYYIIPNVVSGLRLHAKKTDDFFQLAVRMEKSIAATFPGDRPDPHLDLVIWVGITGQKRSWMEQVDGYAQIVRALSATFPDILVYIDGLTAAEGHKIQNESDAGVVKQLTAKIGRSAKVVSLIGLDYPSKIKLCHGVDVFIANGGTGSFVPLRICRKPGLLHSNKSLWTFRGDDYPDTVVFTPPHIVHEITDVEEKKPGRVSYSIAWQEIYNRLLPVLFKVKGVQLEPVPVPPTTKTSAQLDRSLFQKLSERIGPRAGAADILREVALLFEKKGDFATAFAVMEQAQLQRPDGPFINRKLNEYRAALAMASSAPGADTAPSSTASVQHSL